MKKVLFTIFIVLLTSCYLFETIEFNMAVLNFYNESNYSITYKIRNEIITIEPLSEKTVYSSTDNSPEIYTYTHDNLVESRVEVIANTYNIYFSNIVN